MIGAEFGERGGIGRGRRYRYATHFDNAVNAPRATTTPTSLIVSPGSRARTSTRSDCVSN